MKKRLSLLAVGFLMLLNACQSNTNTSGSDTSRTTEHDSIAAKFHNHNGLINDFEQVFNAAQTDSLQSALEGIKNQGKIVLALATVDSIAPYRDIVKFATDLGNRWGLGDSTENNGVLIVFSESLAQVAIVSGVGVQIVYSDTFCESVIQGSMVPQFVNGHYTQGILDGIAAIGTK